MNFLFCGLGCIGCYFLQKEMGWPSFVASAFTGLLASFMPSLKIYNLKKSIAAVYTGSFAAMCSLSAFSDIRDLLFLSFLVGVCFNLLSPYFKGIGGKLGTIGFLSTVLFFIFKVV